MMIVNILVRIVTTKQHIRKFKDPHKSVQDGIKHPCPHCDYQSAQKGSLNRHIQAVHEGIKHLCPYCDYQVTTKGSLKGHKKSAHDSL